MKVTKKHIRLFGYMGMSAASYALAMLVISSLFGIQRYDLRVDDRIAPALNAQLAAHVQTLPCGVRVAPDTNAQIIQAQFPWIRSVSLFRLPTKTMRISVAVDEPRVRVNGAVVTEQSHVLPASTFVPTVFAALPSLSVTFPNYDYDAIPDAFIPHAQKFTDVRFAPYSITWIDEYTARLTDKKQPQFTILFNAYSIPDVAMFTHCASIKRQLEERGSFAGRYKGTRWVVDIRFDRQVILFSEKGGIVHG